jgi:uncharacterized Zn-finger protein
MKITEVGNVGYGFEGNWKCTWCSSKWTLNSLDRVTTLHYDDKDGDYHSMKCPVCGKIANRNIPEGARAYST